MREADKVALCSELGAFEKVVGWESPISWYTIHAKKKTWHTSFLNN